MINYQHGFSDHEETGSEYSSDGEYEQMLMEEAEQLPELPDAASIHCDPALLDPDRYIGFDPSVVHGAMENGMAYFVKKNKTPQQRAELQVIMNVGSVDELDSEQGYAHFIEHLAFRGAIEYTHVNVHDTCI